jgi:hypothetical protein
VLLWPVLTLFNAGAVRRQEDVAEAEELRQRQHGDAQGRQHRRRRPLAGEVTAGSRWHLGAGILSYLASPVWVAFLALGTWQARRSVRLVGISSQVPGSSGKRRSSQPARRRNAPWQGPDGGYWGHNAILRIAAFAANAELPVLPGRAPLGR